MLKEWDYEKNKELGLLPEDIPPGSNKSVYWICPEGHKSYLASPSHRVEGTGCPICAKKRIGEKNSKAVDQLTLDGQYIKTFKSVKAASEACGLSSGAISNAIRKETTSGGFRWQHHK